LLSNKKIITIGSTVFEVWGETPQKGNLPFNATEIRTTSGKNVLGILHVSFYA
jgi:hypothetical protein